MGRISKSTVIKQIQSLSERFKENGKEQRYGWGCRGHSLNTVGVIFSPFGKNLVSSISNKAL